MPLGKVLNFVMAPLGTLIGGKTGRIVSAIGITAVGVMTGNPQLIMAGLAMGAAALQKKPKVSSAALDRLNANLDPNAFRKGAFGRTALNTDIRYGAYTGANQEYWEQIVCTASHAIEAHEEVWFDSELAWTSAGGAQGRFAGYLTVTSRTEGTSANGIAIDSVWTATATLTGCSYLHMKFKLTGNSKKSESPFASSIPTRMTIRGKAAKVPDPRLSSSAGGSGSQNMADQSTWAYATAADSGRNGILQILFVLLGWRINGKLALGCGMSTARIDFASFIAAANVADEGVAKAGGGTRPRYRSDGVFSEGDDPNVVLTGLLEACNAELTDESGKIGIRVDYDDLATPILALTEDDIVDGDDWPLSDSAADVNIVKGQYPDPGDGALYQMRDYPQVTLPGSDYGSPDGIQRIELFPLPFAQDPAQCQWLAALKLQRRQYPGRYRARFKKVAWGARYGRIVTLTHASTGQSAKKWRVARQVLRRDGSVDLELRDVASAMYTPPTEASVTAVVAPTAFNPLNDPFVQQLSTIADGADRTMPLSSNGGVTLTANSAVAASAGAFWSNDPLPEGAMVVGRIVAAGAQVEVALATYANRNVNNGSFAPSYFGIQYNGAGTTYWLHNGSFGSDGMGTHAAGDQYSILYKGTEAIYYRNGVELKRRTAADGVVAGLVLYGRGYFYGSGSVTEFKAGPAGDLTVSNQVVVVPPVDQVVEADSAGNPLTGQLQVLWPKVTKGGADVRTLATTSHSITTVGMTAIVDNSAGSSTKGQITPQTLPSIDAWIDYVVTVDGVAQPTQRIKYHKNVPAAAATGGAGATGASTSAISGTSSASYGAANASALIVRAPSSGIVNLSGSLNFKRTTTTPGSSGSHGKWTWRIVGGVAADLPSGEIASTASAQTINEPPVVQYSGTQPMAASKSGLTPGSDYEFVPYLRSDDGVQLNYTGTLTAAQG